LDVIMSEAVTDRFYRRRFSQESLWRRSVTANPKTRSLHALLDSGWRPFYFVAHAF
jgi:hypothetical protein